LSTNFGFTFGLFTGPRPPPGLGHFGAFTVEELINHEDAEAAAEAAVAVHRADTSVMLDALEKAEQTYQSTHVAPAMPDTHHEGHSTTPDVSEALRDRVRSRIQASLEANRALQVISEAGKTLRVVACEWEQRLYEATRSATVYRSVASNVIRLAREDADLGSVLPVALGRPHTPPARQAQAEKLSAWMDEYVEGIPEASVKVDYT
jgi:hypothetical protein